MPENQQTTEVDADFASGEFEMTDEGPVQIKPQAEPTAASAKEDLPLGAPDMKEQTDRIAAERAKQAEVLGVLDQTGQREWGVGAGDYHRVYLQKPLSFIGKMKWLALVGGVLDKSMQGNGGLTVSSLLETPQGTSLTPDAFRNADTFVQAISKLVMYSPDFMLDSWQIWLNVPSHEEELFKQVVSLPESEGGIGDNMAEQILLTFVAQNGEALRSFFSDRLPRLQRAVTATLQAQQERAKQ